MVTIQTTVYVESLSNFTCSLWMKRGETLLIMGHGVKGQGQLCPLARGYHTLHGLVYFYAPGLKGPPGASSVWIVHLSVCLSVCPSVRNSVPLTNKVQYLKFWWSYSNQTWTVSSSMGSSHFTDIPCPWGGGGAESKCRTWRFLPYFDFVAPGGHPCFTNTCLVLYLLSV